MKKRYSKEDLASIGLQTINIQYDNPQKILDGFKTNIMGKVKSLHSKELTENEIHIYSLKVANDIFENLDKITVEIISVRLSDEIIDKSYNEGIELLESKDYFVKFAKEMVKQLLQAKYNHIKRQIKQTKIKPKKK